MKSLKQNWIPFLIKHGGSGEKVRNTCGGEWMKKYNS